MPMNSAIARMMPVYQGSIVKVEKMRKKTKVGRMKMTSFVFRCKVNLVLTAEGEGEREQW